MKFIDSARIEVTAGKGGNGHVSFRREKYVPMGGPDGGNGGRGGDVIIQADAHMRTLLDFRYKRSYEAESGVAGSQYRRTGRSGEDIILRVPLGTEVRDKETGVLLADMDSPQARVTIVRGGTGGRGNSEFATAVNQAPRNAEPGREGEHRILELTLKVLADVGLVGFPNAGKSTLISAISAARPKIADYPFTTLQPNLGIVRVGDYESFSIADIPGLIEGAHKGKGLGHKFLQHIERAGILVFLIECTSENPQHDYDVLANELQQFDAMLSTKPGIVCLSKVDILTPEQKEDLKHHPFVSSNAAILLSGVSGEGCDTLIRTAWKLMHEL